MALVDVILPDLGEGVTEGEVVNWLVKPGDTVAADQTVLEVMTDKATMEVPTPYAGVVKEIKVAEGDIIEIETVILTMESDAAGAPVSKPDTPKKEAPKAASAPSPAAKSAPAASSNDSGLAQVILPDLGEGVTEGEVVNWLVGPGDTVAADQTVLEVMTDKATMEVPTPYAGTVKELKVEVGAVIEIETVIMTMESSDAGAASAPKNEEKAPVAVATPSVPAQNTRAPSGIHPPVAGQRVLASPSTRKLAREMNIDINQIAGTGDAGRVMREDVLKGGGSASSGAVASIPSSRTQIGQSTLKDEREPIRGIRRKIVQSMAHSKATIPHFTLMDEANVTDLVTFRKQAKFVGKDYGVNVTFLPLVMKALVSALNEFPMFNASIDDDANEIVYKKRINIGFAADTPNGLVVPVIKNADQKSIIQISKEISELATKARDGKLSTDDMKDATITVTNIGSIAGTYATPIINHPQVAIVGMYKIQDKPVYKDGKFKRASVMNYTVTCDHRLIDGAVAARFMSKMFERLENPSHFMLEMI